MEAEKRILPQFPRTLHLPWKPNAQRNDLVASEKEADVVLSSDRVEVTEKIDGANVGVAFLKNNLLVRNHNHILRKGYLKNTPAKIQFRPLWNWAYDHRELFVKLGPFSVYGEWMLAQHGLEYNQLPALFIAHSLYDYEAGKFVDSILANSLLLDAGFNIAPVLISGNVASFADLEALTLSPASFTTKGQKEGVYIKVNDGCWTTHRFKMIRAGFVQGALWSETELKPNTVQKGHDERRTKDGDLLCMRPDSHEVQDIGDRRR